MTSVNLHKTSPSAALRKTCKVSHIQDHLVALCSALTPAEQRVSLGASMATQQQVETVLGPDNNKIYKLLRASDVLL